MADLFDLLEDDDAQQPQQSAGPRGTEAGTPVVGLGEKRQGGGAAGDAAPAPGVDDERLARGSSGRAPGVDPAGDAVVPPRPSVRAQPGYDPITNHLCDAGCGRVGCFGSGAEIKTMTWWCPQHVPAWFWEIRDRSR